MKTQFCTNCKGRLITVLDKVFDTRFGANGFFTISRCLDCDLSQLIPLPTQENLKKLYEAHYNFGQTKNRIYSSLREIFFSHILYNLWMLIDGDISFHAVKSDGTLLDIGCNEGRGLAIYEKNGFEVEGIELNSKAAALATKRGFKVNTCLIENFHPEKQYDVVVLSNVLEHTLYPNIFLSNVARLLKPDGEVWISCPNVDSWQRKLFGKYWINWHVPFHTIHFSNTSIARIMKNAGFAIKEIRNESPALWFVQSLIVFIFSKMGRPTRQLRNTLLVVFLIALTRGVLSPILWLGNRLAKGDCLVLTAKKVGLMGS